MLFFVAENTPSSVCDWLQVFSKVFIIRSDFPLSIFGGFCQPSTELLAQGKRFKIP